MRRLGAGHGGRHHLGHHEGRRRRAVEEFFRPRGLVRGIGGEFGFRREAWSGAALDMALDDHIVRPADQEQVFHVVPPQQDQLTLPVEFVDVDDAEPRLAAAPVRPPVEGRSPPGQPPEQQDRPDQQNQDDQEDHQELHDEGAVGTEERLQDRCLSPSIGVWFGPLVGPRDYCCRAVDPQEIRIIR